MGAFSIWHIVVIAIVAAFLFFGWKQLPDMARSFGRSLRVFKTEIKGLTDDDAAREKARDEKSRETDVAESRQVEAAKPARPAAAAPEPRVAPRAEMVRNSAGPRPRPAPNPNGRPRA